MNIGEIIKKLRKQKGITQEQLAEYLNISPQAVSRWEINSTLPDITLIPMITNIFNVTSDQLLGIDIAKNKDKIRKILDLSHEKFREGFAKQGLIDEAIQICRNGIAEFPNNYVLLSWLANCLWNKSSKAEYTDIEKDKCISEVISIRNRILDECTDDRFKYGSLQQLAFAYYKLGNKEKALEFANKLPSYQDTNDDVLWVILDGEEKFKKGIDDIFRFVYSLEARIEVIAHLESDKSDKDDIFKDEKKGLLKKIIDIMNTVYPDDTGIPMPVVESERYRAVVAELKKYAKKDN
jgi:transcriptional regulator with XRE-family HTH domain